MRKLLSVGLIIAVCLALMSCHSSEKIKVVDTGKEERLPEETAAVKKTEKAIPKEDLKIGMIYSADPAEGFGYIYTHDLGIQQMQKELGLSNAQIIRENNISETDEKALEKAVEECLEKGCNILFAVGQGYEKAFAKLAEENPSVYFAHAGGSINNGKNLSHYFGREYEAKYLAGIAAGLKTQTGRIGYIAAWGKENSFVTSGINAFAMGVYSVNEAARIYVQTTDSWFDNEREEEAAEELIKKGCDVIALHAGTPAAMIKAEENDIWAVGCDSDMSTDAKDAVLVSTTWNWGVYYTQTVQSLLNGTWENTDYLGGMKEGIVRLSGLASFNAPEAAARIEQVQASLLSGEFRIFSGEIETNEGTVVGEKDKVLEDKEIFEKMDWYFKNIVDE